jgi:hypothetical protein
MAESMGAAGGCLNLSLGAYLGAAICLGAVSGDNYTLGIIAFLIEATRFLGIE